MAQVSLEGGSPQILMPAALGAMCVLVAAAAGLGLFVFAAVRTPAAAPVALLAGSTVRMLVSLSLALVVYFVGGMSKPAGMVFWIVFLACGLAAIVAEAAWGVKNLARLSTDRSTDTPDGAVPSAGSEAH